MRSARIAFVSAAIVAIAAASDAGQGAGRPPRDVGAGPAPAGAAAAVIRGRVVEANGGPPVRRADVSALSGGAVLRSTRTDDEGRFELADLPAGTWYVSVSKTGYLTQPFGARRAFEAAVPISLADGQQVTADVALTRAAAVAGRVYDEYGEPIAGARMTVFRARMAQRRRHLQPVGDADTTDDTGAFRIYGLPPGEYYVAGSLRLAPGNSIVQTTHSPTYYPGTGALAEAQRVLLSAGSEAVVNFPLLPFRTTHVAGTVLTAAGTPAKAFLNLTSDAGELGTPLGIGGVTRDDGTFTLPEVPPGTFTLTASLLDGGVNSEAAAVPVAVYGDDVTGLTLVTAKPGSLRGTFVADAGVTRRLPADVSVVARSIRAGGESTFAEVEDNAFDLTAPHGPFQLTIEPPDGWAVKSIVLRESDATDAVIDIGSEQQVPVRVILTDRLTEVSGTITGGDAGRPPSIVVFPEDPAKWTQAARYLRAVATDDGGRFRVAGLPANMRYLAVAVDALEEGEGEDPDFLARVRDQAVAFGLAEGEQRILAVPLVRR